MLHRMQVTAALAALAIPALTGAAMAQKDVTPRPADKFTQGDNEVRELMLLVASGKDGKVSKEEWIRFMSQEFDRLDKQRTGQLDAKQIEQPKAPALRVERLGK